MNVGTEALVLLSTRGKFNKKIGCYELNKKKNTANRSEFSLQCLDHMVFGINFSFLLNKTSMASPVTSSPG